MRGFLLRCAALPLFTLIVLLQGCGGEPPLPANPPKPPPQAQPDQNQATIVAPNLEQPLNEKEGTENYTYDPEGRPDPFKSILLAGIARDQHLVPPLQQREVTEMKVIAIIWGGLGQSAMLQMPDGKGYTIRVGTRVGPNEGVVRKITPQEVIVEERYTDVFGEMKSREVILELRLSGEKTE